MHGQNHIKKALYNFVNSSLGYLAWPDDGLIRVKKKAETCCHSLDPVLHNKFIAFDLYVYYLLYLGTRLLQEVERPGRGLNHQPPPHLGSKLKEQ